MIRICFVTTVGLTLRMFILKTAEYLHANTDWDISFICSYDEDLKNSLPEYIHYFPVKMERGISISGIKAMLEMKKIFSEEKFDLIQYSTPNASLYASLAGKAAGVPIRLYCQWGMAFVGFKGIKRTIFKMEERLVCSLSTWIEPDSYSNLKYAHEQSLYAKEKGSVIWNGSACGVDLEKFDITKKVKYRSEIRDKYMIPADAFVFGFVGRITRDKGINELLESFKQIVSKYEETYLFMIGPDETDNTVDEKLYQWAMNSEKVIFTGYTNRVEMFLAAINCYVLPSYREGFGMGVIEAEAMGIPVIVTNIPGPIDAMENEKTGVVINKADTAALYQAMCGMMFNKEICNQYGKAGQVYAVTHFEQKKLFALILEDRKRLLEKV